MRGCIADWNPPFDWPYTYRSRSSLPFVNRLIHQLHDNGVASLITVPCSSQPPDKTGSFASSRGQTRQRHACRFQSSTLGPFASTSLRMFHAKVCIRGFSGVDPRVTPIRTSPGLLVYHDQASALPKFTAALCRDSCAQLAT